MSYQLVVMRITGIPEFDFFFSLTFSMGFLMFAVAAPMRLFLNRYM